jgi:matrixin
MMDRLASSRRVLAVETLEERSTPAQFANPWSDPTHLTLSFVPDGTSALGARSAAQSVLSRALPQGAWQSAILRAVQTWSAVANIDVGLVADGGQKFGVAGPAQGDDRFGDIRVGGIAMGGDALAAAIPPDPAVVGSLSGDIFFNTRARFTFDKLYRVALHEVGHALGLAPSTDPMSVMFNILNQNPTLSPSDISAIQELYGGRVADPHEGSNGNNSIDRATQVDVPSGYNGHTPLAVFGDISLRGDVDVYEVRNSGDYRGPITFRLQTLGVSLLAARIVVMNEAGQVLGSATGSGLRGGVLSVTLPSSISGEKYFVRVLSAPGAFADVGRYALGVVFNQLAQPPATPLSVALRGPYDALDADDVEQLFIDPEGAYYNDDGGTDDDAADAGRLNPVAGFPENSLYRITASLASAADADFYTIRAPQTAGGVAVLTATVRAVGPNGSTPRIQLFKLLDEVTGQLEPVSSTILANGGGTFAVQAVGVADNTDYVLRIGDAAGPGNYALDASFLTRAAVLKPLTNGSLSSGASLGSTLFVGRSQAFGLSLTANGPVGANIAFSIVNASGRTIFSLVAPAGDTMTASTILLPPGKYTLRATAQGQAGLVEFGVNGSVITDPIGPRPVNSATAAQYLDPVLTGTYQYPTSPTPTQTTDPYLFLPWFTI